MKRHSKDGFTIIELLFFVAISGLLTVALLAGWTVTVNAQNYKDSARSFAVALQDQYNDSTNITIDRDASYQCLQGATPDMLEVKEVEKASQYSRGASDCVIMGKYIYLNDGVMTSRALLGKEPASGTPLPTADKDIIKSYIPTALDASLTTIPTGTFTVPWSTKPYLVGQPRQPVRIVLVIVQSPVSNIVYTYYKYVTANAEPPTARNVIDTGAQSEITLCLDPQAVVGQGILAVRLRANASSSEAVSVVGDVSNGCN